MCSYLIFPLALASYAAAAGNFRGTGHVSSEQVQSIFGEELRDSHHHLAAFEGKLRKLYTSLPKNAHGKLGHETVRYALRRYFMHSYGWLMSGLEAESPSGWVPDFVLAALEGRAGAQGIDLHDLATIAASLEDLVEQTTRERLRTAANTTFDPPRAGNLSRDEAADILETYVMMSLSPNTWKVEKKGDLVQKKTYFRKHSTTQFRTITEWYTQIRDRHLSAFASDSQKLVSFEALALAADELDKNFHVFFDHDCKAMKTTLSKQQGRRAGRVRLAAFYNMSLYAEWDFNEKEEYLRDIGALDEEANPPSVIITNYALGRLNCLNETSLYASCCRNTCEDLMEHLEDKVGASSASVDGIAALVAQLPSETISAPRELQGNLLARLGDVAKLNGGVVPLHGRLFAQWMHHAYPLECPYPHEAGSTRAAAEVVSLSEEEVRQVVQADTCTVNWEGTVDCGEESTDLPWSSAEELLAPSPSATPSTAGLGVTPGLMIVGLGLLAAAGLTWRGRRLGTRASEDALQLRLLALLLLLTGAAYAAELLDGVVFAIALISGGAALGMRLAARVLGGREACLPTQAKKV